MNLTSPSQVKAWCIGNGFHPNRVMGQNFLIDRNALVQIVDAARLESVPGPERRVLEIGPGLGVLTEELLARGAAVKAVEKDPVLAARLPAALGGNGRLTVVGADALDVIRDGGGDGFAAMVSNLPYQAGTRILLELIARADAGAAVPETIVVLVQTEVAERLAAPPGSRTRSLSGVWAQLDYAVELVREVKASCFWPRPEVGSTVVRMVRHHLHDDLGADRRRRLRQLAKTAFEHRRKQLGSIFKGRIGSTARAEALAVADWIAIAGEMPDE